MDKIQSAIFKFDNKVDQTWCKNSVKYMDLVCKQKADVLAEDGTKILTNQRDVWTYGLNQEDKHDSVYIQYLHTIFNDCVKRYIEIFSHINTTLRYEGMNLLKYDKGNFYKCHIDQHPSVNRCISIILSLNNNYEGGELVFFNPTTNEPYSSCKLGEGDILLFPSNFLYPHAVAPVKEGTRYSVVVWVG